MPQQDTAGDLRAHTQDGLSRPRGSPLFVLGLQQFGKPRRGRLRGRHAGEVAQCGLGGRRGGVVEQRQHRVGRGG
jgi:hypothetical protein